jgi:hypothetical protein
MESFAGWIVLSLAVRVPVCVCVCVQDALLRYQTEELVKEIAILKKVHHPNIVNLVEVIDDPSTDSLLLVMEYVEGGTLQPRQVSPGHWEPLAEREVWRYVREVLQVGWWQGGLVAGRTGWWLRGGWGRVEWMVVARGGGDEWKHSAMREVWRYARRSFRWMSGRHGGGCVSACCCVSCDTRVGTSHLNSAGQ